ncbi:MAG: hypothetical protein AB1640_16785 [bacterium]
MRAHARRPRESAALLFFGLALVSALRNPSPLPARELYQQGETSLALGATYKNLFLGNRFYEIPGEEDRVFSTDYQRARLMADARFPFRTSVEVHYQHLTFLDFEQAPLSLLGTRTVGDTGSAFRYTALAWDLEETSDFLWRHELDRLSLSVAWKKLDFIFGRQAITWGTGRFWQPTDLFSPFGPLQIDREFKAGTDAASLSLALGGFTETRIVWAFGRDGDPDRSAGLVRFKTLWWNYDFSLLAGRVRTDEVAGGDFAGDLAETGIGIHGEALFNKVRDGSDYGQIVAGADYRFPGKGPYLLGEYYYFGAGTTDGPGLVRALQDERILSRGTFQLGRHYLGLGATYEIFPILAGMFNVLVNLTDPSAVLNPGLDYSVADNASATLGVTIPVGETPTFALPSSALGVPQVGLNSEFGTYPYSFYLEVKLYVQ